MISVDGDTSTNDTFLVMANALAGNETIAEEESEDYADFLEALTAVCTDLAKMQAGDGEGATKLVEACVTGMDTKENARILAKSVICSNLTKAAMYGNDANWGRILCALGYAGVSFDPEQVDLYFEKDGERILIYTNGAAADYSEEEATKFLSGEAVRIVAQMHMGEAEATAWGCDLTYDYVKINADYRS
ncbi:MAG: bifunctional ornithine acetyltransferase/N-acetylglutamate synthase, partial [Eubacteriales bacterium]|nr:bifunctional ornithine acetyltransferase/N-acetylglutamate synthase [Eubacteriales bacterium]